MAPAGDHKVLSRVLVSVCVVTFNHERYIQDCLRSVLAQLGDAELEILVGDDGSTDATRPMLAALAAEFPQVHVFNRESNLGPIGNLLDLLQRTTGQYICHLDGDDLWLPGKLREQLRLIEDAAVSAVYTNAIVYDDQREPVGVFTNANAGTYDRAALLERGNFLNHSSLLYRARDRPSVLALPAPFIDFRIHLMLASKGELRYTSKVLVGYRQGAVGSMLATANAAVREQYWQAIVANLSSDDPVRLRVAAASDFLRRVAFRAIRTRTLGLVMQWWTTVRRDLGVPGITLLATVAVACMAELWRQCYQWGAMRMRRRGTRILYFR
jgi:glycosyltransferase involved in cell wall biosynthesis